MKGSGIDWIGKIPESWLVKRLKFSTSSMAEKSDRLTNSLPYIGLENIEPYTTKLINVNNEMEESDAKLFKKQNVLFGKLRPYLAKVWMADFNGRCTSEFLVLKEVDYEPNFLKFLLICDGCIKTIDSSTYGAKMPRAEWGFIGNMKLPLPELNEQKQISDFLDSQTKQIDSQIGSNQKLITLLQEKRQSTINQAVTKGLDPSVPMKDSGIEGIGEIPEHWELTKFRRISTLRQGLQIPIEKRYEESSSNRLPYITIRYLNSSKQGDHVDYIENASSRVICHKDDILLARTGATGEVVTGIQGVFHNNFFAIDYDRKKIFRDFLVHYLKDNYVKEHILLLAGTTTIPDLNHDEFLDVVIPLPSKTEQEQISDFLDKQTSKINSLISKTETQIEKLQEFRQSLISTAVTGKMKIPQHH